MAVTVHIERPNLVGHAVHHGAAGGGTGLTSVNSHAEGAPLGHILDVNVAGLVLRGKSGIDDHIVNRQAHCLVGAATAGNADVPCQIQVTACCKVQLELLACDGSGADGHNCSALGGSIRSEVGVEIVTSAAPRVTIGRDVELHGKAGGVVAIAVLLDVVVECQLGNGLVTRVVQAGHHADATGTTVDRGRQSTHRAVTGIAAGSKVPGAVLGIAGKASTARVHDGGRCRSKAAHSARGVHLALHTPSLRHVERRSLGCVIPHAVKVLSHLGSAGSYLQRILCPSGAASHAHDEQRSSQTE